MQKKITFTLASAMLFAALSAQAGTGVAVKGPVHSTPQIGSGGGAAGLTITDVTVGPFEGYYPQYGPGYVALPYPQNTIIAGSSVVFTIQMQDNFFSGAPTVYYTLVQGGAVIQSGSVAFDFDLVPNEEALAYFPETAPTTPGPATVIMEVYNGATLVGSSNYHIFIY